MDTPPELSPWLVQMLLVGFNAPIPGGGTISSLPISERAQVKDLFRGGAAGIAVTWDRHADFLLAEAERLKVPKRWALQGKRMYFGERLSGLAAARRNKTT